MSRPEKKQIDRPDAQLTTRGVMGVIPCAGWGNHGWWFWGKYREIRLTVEGKNPKFNFQHVEFELPLRKSGRVWSGRRDLSRVVNFLHGDDHDVSMVEPSPEEEEGAWRAL